MLFLRVLEEFDLLDQVDALRTNGICKERDLGHVDAFVLQEMSLTPVCKAKLKKLIAAHIPSFVAGPGAWQQPGPASSAETGAVLSHLISSVASVERMISEGRAVEELKRT